MIRKQIERLSGRKAPRLPQQKRQYVGDWLKLAQAASRILKMIRLYRLTESLTAIWVRHKRTYTMASGRPAFVDSPFQNCRDRPLSCGGSFLLVVDLQEELCSILLVGSIHHAIGGAWTSQDLPSCIIMIQERQAHQAQLQSPGPSPRAPRVDRNALLMCVRCLLWVSVPSMSASGYALYASCACRNDRLRR